MKSLKLIILLILCTPLTCHALNYEITDFQIEATLNEKGDMHVCETIVQNGNFNGYVRELEYRSDNKLYSGSDITNIEVYKANPNTFEKQNPFTKVSSASNGESYKYIMTKTADGYDVKMFQKGGDVGYLLCYDVLNAAVLHNDYGELYWNFIGNDFEDDLNNVTIKVNLPGIDEDLRVWGHGPLSGYVSRNTNNSNSYLEAKITKVNAYQPVDVRMLFNKDLIKESTKTSNKEIYEEVLKEEQQKAAEANATRKKAKFIHTLELIVFYSFFPISIFIIIFCYKKYDKEPKINYDHEYQREFPSEDGPEYLDYLLDRSISDRAYQATILEIIRKRALKVEKLDDKKNNYLLVNQEQYQPYLTEEEAMIHSFLLNNIGNGKEFSLDDMKKYPKKESNARAWTSHIQSWKTKVLKKATAKNYFEKNQSWIVAILYFIYVIFACICGRAYEVISVILIIMVGLATFIYLCLIKKRTKEGALLYKKWIALKHFLEDFGRFDEKELPEIVLWERYLVYATVFGIADKVEKAMRVKIDTYHMDTSYDPYTMYLLHDSLNTTIASSVARANQESHATIARSVESSGSGFGGGFSGGGGFGGGGGGGHGF